VADVLLQLWGQGQVHRQDLLDRGVVVQEARPGPV